MFKGIVLFQTVLFILTVISVAAQPGSLDPTFGSGGKLLGTNLNLPLDTFLVDDVPDAATQSDGKIVVVATTNSQMTVFRFNANGTPDTTFGINGIAMTNGNQGLSVTANAVAIQPDGKIIVGGSAITPNATLVNRSDAAVARFNSDGSLDTTFANGAGKLFINRATVEGVRKIVLQPDGKIVFTGDRNNRLGSFNYPGVNLFAIRLTSNGIVETNFDATSFGDRSLCQSCGDSSRSLVLQPDGKVVVFGNVSGFNNGAIQSGLGIARFLSDGQLDPTFGNGGKVFSVLSSSQNPSQTNHIFNTAALQIDGKFVVGGSATPSGGSADFAIFRYTAAGEFDNTFNGNGKIILSIESSHDIVNKILIQTNGKIIAAGESSVNFAIARFNPNGSIDNTFAGNGVVITDFNNNQELDKITNAVLQANGKILAAGYTRINIDSVPRLALARYNGDVPAALRTRFDFDGDAKADISVFRTSNGAWYIDQSTAGFTGLLFGLGTDLPVPADYDGDGKTDVAVFRDGYWYYLRSSDNSFVALQWGLSTDIALPADFDGDGKADINVFRPSNGFWYRLNSSNGQPIFNEFGQNGDKPLNGDFNGDGKADLAVFRPLAGSFYIARPTGIPAQNFDSVQFGVSTDLPTPADFDGDGKTDIAVFRPSNGSWYRLNSSDGSFFGAAFGLNGDIPTAADYDGDGKADISVFRNGNWYRLNSSNGAFSGQTFGLGTDKPLPAAS